MNKVSYSSGDVARFCDVTSRTVIRWIEAGKLKAFKLPGRGNNRIEETELLSFFDANGIPTPDELKTTVKDKNSIIISDDNHFTRHAKRLVRNSDYVTHHYSNEIEAGIGLANLLPELIVLDTLALQSDKMSIKDYASIILKSSNSFATDLIICSESDTGIKQITKKHNVHFMLKPLDLSKFAELLDKLNDQE